jgi:hypothetical protein
LLVLFLEGEDAIALRSGIVGEGVEVGEGEGEKGRVEGELGVHLHGEGREESEVVWKHSDFFLRINYVI